MNPHTAATVSLSLFLSVAAARQGHPAESAAPPPAVPDTSPTIHEAVLNAPPAEVWKVWSTAEGFKALGVAQAEMDFRVGGLLRTHYKPDGRLGDDGTIQHRILAYEPERMLAFRIDQPPRGFPFPAAWKSTWSVVTLTDLGDGRTHLRLAGLGYSGEDESQAMRRFFLSGNEWSMKKLAAHFDSRKAPAVPAQAHAESPLAPVEVSSVIPANGEEVWDALTTSAGWKSLFGCDSSIELRPGGRFEIYFKPDAPAGKRGSETCTVLSYDPRRMLSFTWNAPPQFEHARGLHTWVVVTFEPVSGRATRVTFKHLGFAERAAEKPEHAEEFKQARTYFTSAWPKVLGALKTYFEGRAKKSAE